MTGNPYSVRNAQDLVIYAALMEVETFNSKRMGQEERVSQRRGRINQVQKWIPRSGANNDTCHSPQVDGTDDMNKHDKDMEPHKTKSIQHHKRKDQQQTKLQEEWCDTPERIITSIDVNNRQRGLSDAALVQFATSERKLPTGTTLKMANVFSPLSEGNEARKQTEKPPDGRINLSLW